MAKTYNFIYAIVYAHDQTQIRHICNYLGYIPLSQLNVFGHVHYIYSDLMQIDLPPFCRVIHNLHRTANGATSESKSITGIHKVTIMQLKVPLNF